MRKQKPAKNNTLLSLSLNTGLTCLELVAGITIGSAALVADGLKNLTDSLLLVIALAADWLCRGKPRRSSRIRVLAGWCNAVLLLAVTGEIFHESYRHLRQPSRTQGALVILIAIVAIAINLIAAIKIRQQKNHADRAAFFGLLSSAVSGCCVLISGILSTLFNIEWVDGAAGLAIATILTMVDIKLIYSLTRIFPSSNM